MGTSANGRNFHTNPMKIICLAARSIDGDSWKVQDRWTNAEAWVPRNLGQYGAGWVCWDISKANTRGKKPICMDPNDPAAGLSTKTLHGSVEFIAGSFIKRGILECVVDKNGMRVALKLLREIGPYAAAAFIIDARTFKSKSSRNRMCVEC
jgi:hypothetical protein